MSHFTAVSTANIVSKEAFIAGVKELGFANIKISEGNEVAKIRGWNGQLKAVDVAVRVPNCKYDFGIIKNGNKFDLIAEDYLNRYEKPGILGKVIQFTTKHQIVADYRRKGFFAQVTVKEDESLHVTLTK